MNRKRIKNIEFGILSPDVIRKMSAVRVIVPDTYDMDGFPFDGGLMDLRMGVIDPGLRCKTCGGKIGVCTGHFGHIELARPVLHVGYIKHILTLLKSTCKECGRLLVPKEKVKNIQTLLENPDDVALELISSAKQIKKCPHCGAQQGTLKLEKPYLIFEEDQRLFPNQIRERLEKIPDDDLKILGFNPEVMRPEWLVLTVLPVPPVTVRTSIILETGQRSEDDLTHKLVDVIRINQRVEENISAGAPQVIIEDLWDLLQYHVATYLNNEIPGLPPARHRNGRPLRTLFQRLKGKQGIFRSYLIGKRVNFSARSVIICDPNLSIEEVGIPLEIAKILTVPEYVTQFNLENMQKFILNNEYPKAISITLPDGKKKIVTEFNKEEIAKELKPGYIVERQIIDGDIALFNRQPSLHRMSLMAHKIKVLPGKAIRMNDAVTTPYNADFDGDEMNIHIPQTLPAQIEAKMLLSVKNHLISSGDGSFIIQPKLDEISGIIFLTSKDTKVSKELAGKLLGCMNKLETINDSESNAISGKKIFSTILPPIDLECKSKMCKVCGTCEKEKCPYDAYVVIKKGELKFGTVDKESLKKILEEIYKKYGPEATVKFIDECSLLGLNFAHSYGLTIGVDEYFAHPEYVQKVEEILNEMNAEVKEIINAYLNGQMERLPGKTLDETREVSLLLKINSARIKAAKLLERYLKENNAAYKMVKGGVKGNELNLVQMMGLQGQVTVGGKRIERGFRGRTLTFFKQEDYSPAARGFIKSSFRKGLNPIEYFMQAAGGRDSTIDKGLNTADSGYFYRRLANALLDITARKDGLVTDSTNQVIQFKYGEDGIFPNKQIYLT